MKRTTRNHVLAIAEETLSYVPHRPTVLVASESKFLRRSVANALRGDGYSVDESSLDQALSPYVGPACWPGDPVDVLVIDTTGHPERGLALIEAIRAFDWALRIIVLFDAEDVSAEQEAARLGANAVFVRPVDVDDLRTVVLNVAPTVERHLGIVKTKALREPYGL